MVERTAYLNELRKWREDKVIKVITGLRRCGKSTLLLQFQDILKQEGIPADRIISLNFEALENDALLNYHALHQYIIARLTSDEMNYIFLDEIQMVPDFQKAVDSLYIRDNVDLYVTGSNAYLLSGELATLLSGRYIEINMLPLSFQEYYQIKGGEGSSDQTFLSYLQHGSMPYVAMMSRQEEKAGTYLEGIYNTIILKDIELRQNRRETDPNKRKITDLALLKRIAKYLASAIGNPIAVNHIQAAINETGRGVSFNTVSDYIEALIEPYLFYPVERFDIVGKQILKQNRKIYIVDLGIQKYLLARENYDLGFSLENLVYLELRRRGFSVNIGKLGQKEVDFVARKGDNIFYYQVTASMLDQNTFNREIGPLKMIQDNYPKTVLTLDRFTSGNYGGILVTNLIDWLLQVHRQGERS